MYVMRLITNLEFSGRTYKWKTLHGAQEGAARIVGDNPRKDPDGYAVDKNGNCLFFVQNCDFESIFPVSAVMEA